MGEKRLRSADREPSGARQPQSRSSGGDIVPFVFFLHNHEVRVTAHHCRQQRADIDNEVSNVSEWSPLIRPFFDIPSIGSSSGGDDALSRDTQQGSSRPADVSSARLYMNAAFPPPLCGSLRVVLVDVGCSSSTGVPSKSFVVLLPHPKDRTVTVYRNARLELAVFIGETLVRLEVGRRDEWHVVLERVLRRFLTIMAHPDAYLSVAPVIALHRNAAAMVLHGHDTLGISDAKSALTSWSALAAEWSDMTDEEKRKSLDSRASTKILVSLYR